MRPIDPKVAFALLFAALSVIAVIAGHYGRNPYYLVAAASFMLATYVTCPPPWVAALAKVLPGKRNDPK